jgi:hypothetical protein
MYNHGLPSLGYHQSTICLVHFVRLERPTLHLAILLQVAANRINRMQIRDNPNVAFKSIKIFFWFIAR